MKRRIRLETMDTKLQFECEEAGRKQSLHGAETTRSGALGKVTLMLRTEADTLTFTMMFATSSTNQSKEHPSKLLVQFDTRSSS